MPEPFFRTIVLMLKDDPEKGSMGVVLNRPKKETLQVVWQQMEKSIVPERLNSLYLHNGGPVFGPLVAVHNNPDFSEDKVVDGLFTCAETVNLEGLVQTDSKFRIFTGYAGWGKSQLDYELRAGAWLTLACDLEFVFNDDFDIWIAAKRRWSESIMTSLGAKADRMQTAAFN
jgi:putative transcriptional regulator